MAQLRSHTSSLLVGLTHRAAQRENTGTCSCSPLSTWQRKTERATSQKGTWNTQAFNILIIFTPFKAIRPLSCVRHACFRKWLPLLSGLLAPPQLQQAQCQKAQSHHLRAGALEILDTKATAHCQKAARLSVSPSHGLLKREMGKAECQRQEQVFDHKMDCAGFFPYQTLSGIYPVPVRHNLDLSLSIYKHLSCTQKQAPKTGGSSPLPCHFSF